MSDCVRATIGEAFDLTLATSPRVSGAVVVLTTIHDASGDDSADGADGEALVFPITLTEGASGVYSTEVSLPEAGVYWARFTVDGVAVPPIILRAVADGFPGADASADTPYVVAVALANNANSVQVTLSDSAGEDVGNDDVGEPIVWPEAMTQVLGYANEWYFESVTFEEAARVQVTITPDAGAVHTDVISVHADPSPGTLAHYNGWEPDTGIIPEDWIPLSYVRRWTGWTAAHISASQLREFRRMAIETFISATNFWVPAWAGTWYGLRAQGKRLYLPGSIILPANGGVEPVITVIERHGNQEMVEEINNQDVVWCVGGRYSKQPYIERYQTTWDSDFDVKIYATWGWPTATFGLTKFKQVIVGLMRWHSLSFGTDADDARAQGTANFVLSESNRDMRQELHVNAIGEGITGDRVVDRALYEFRVEPGPWVSRSGGSAPESIENPG